MNINKETQKNINKLVSLYFEYNPSMNRGIQFKIKANDIIKSYLCILNKPYSEIEKCIIENPDYDKPIWELFKNYFNKDKVSKDKKGSNYKDSINTSINPEDWI